MKTKLPQYYPLVLLALIVCFQSGCKTTGTSDTKIGSGFVASSKVGPDVESMNAVERKVEFFRVKSELIAAKVEERTGLNEQQVRTIKERLEEGWDVDIFGFFKVNASSDGVVYKKEFLKDKNGSIKTGIDDDGDAFFTLAIAF
jgi:hypothetical protein